MRNLSVSEINSYLQCGRAWDLTSASRQRLKHKITPKLAFVIGSAIHEAIDAQASGQDPMEVFEAYVVKERRERVDHYRDVVGTSPWASEQVEFDEGVDLARALTTQYFDHYGWENPLEDLGLKYLATEVPFSIPLGDDWAFVGTFDGIATDIATESRFYLLENKSAARKPNMRNIQSGNQYVGYNWAFWKLTGTQLSGTIYNGIIKNLIKTPKLLKSGALSVDKNARVTVKSFLEALQTGGHDPVKYLDYMSYLQEREDNGDERFFIREKFTYPTVQLENWYTEVLLPVAQDMKFVPRTYPNFTSCDGCLVRDICDAMQFGEDVSQVIQINYDVKTYGTIQAVEGVTPDTVTDTDDLVALLRG